MKVKELVQWLAAFEDQDADVLIMSHTSGTGHYDQGGWVRTAKFDPERHADYTDLRGNPFVKPGDPHENSRTLLLGELKA